MDKIKEKMLKACNFAVTSGKTIVKTSWSSGWAEYTWNIRQRIEKSTIECPNEINPLLTALYFIDRNAEKEAYLNNHKGFSGPTYYSNSKNRNSFTNYWNHYSDDFALVEKYLGCDKAWICGFILGWLYTTRQKTIRSKDLNIIPKEKRKSFAEGFKFSKSFRPLVNSIAVRGPKIKNKTYDFIKWSLKQGLDAAEIKTIVDEALTSLVIDL